MNPDHLDLGALQNWMQEKLVYPGQASGGEIDQFVKPSSRQSPAERLAIYQRSYYLRLIKCMEEQFPALCHALGKDLFDAFAGQFLRVQPSESYTLYELGKRFPSYLQETRPDKDAPEAQKEDWIEFMIELAQFERDVFVMFDAPGHEGKPYATIGVPNTRLRLQPCFSLHRSKFPVAWFYHEVRLENDPNIPREAPSFVALARRDFLTQIVPLTPVHHRFLFELSHGKSIDKALEIVAGISGRTFEDVSSAWSNPRGIRNSWIDAGFFFDAESGS